MVHPYLQQRNLLPLQTGQKMQYQQDKCTFFLLLCLRAILCFLMGLSSVWVLSDDVLFPLLCKMDLLDLQSCDKHLQRVEKKKKECKGNL